MYYISSSMFSSDFPPSPLTMCIVPLSPLPVDVKQRRRKKAPLIWGTQRNLTSILIQPRLRLTNVIPLVFCSHSILVLPRRLCLPDVLTFHFTLCFKLRKSSWINFLLSSRSSRTVVLLVIFDLLG